MVKLANYCKIIVTLPLFTIVFALLAYPAKADTIIHESATLGPTGQTSGWGLRWEQFIGSRFYVNQQVEVTAIGGHLTEWTAGNLFGAIIALTGPDDLPDGSPFYSPEVVASTVFDPGYPSSDFRTPLAVTLQPGYYALVFGTDELGASNGEGAMPYGGQVDLPGASYFVWAYDSYWGWDWYNSDPVPPPRFVVEGFPGYCGASGGGEEYISGVQVGTINNTNTGSDGYADYTHLSTTMEIGTGYLITVTNGNPYYDGQDQCGIWVDWNQDKDFDDPNETIAVSDSPGLGPYTATITPPADANLGDTRMRIRIMYTGTLSPCGATTYGEVEDYTITVAENNNGKISGSKFNDLNGDGDWDGDEPGVQGWEIYLDLNGNRQYELNEPNTVTESNGYYEFTDLAPDLYAVEEVDRAGWQQTYPGNEGRHTATIDPDEAVSNLNFGNRETSGTVISLQVIEDTYANSDNPDTNYGSANGFVSGMDGGSVCRSFLKFDLSSIPPGQLVISAKLRLDNSFISFPAPELGVYYIHDSWDESTLTWNNMPSSNEFIPIDQGYISGEITVFDVTADVDTQYAGDGVYSLLIKSMDESLDQSASFWSRDLGWPPIAPTLEVEYEPIFGGGTGEPNNPYQIWTGEQFNSIGLYPNRWDKHFKLMADIDLSRYTGREFNIIGESLSPYADGPFTGVFDGNEHTISNFSYSSNGGRSYIGIFGYVWGSGEIRDLGLISPNIYRFGDTDYAGPLVGKLRGTITACWVEGGSVTGDNYVGGLVGYNDYGNISSCYSTTSVTGQTQVGGLVGRNDFGYISNCYAKGTVSGNSSVGGLVGHIFGGRISDSYSSSGVSGNSAVGGLVGYEYFDAAIITNSFWDIQTSGEPNSAGGTGLTTTEMQDMDTFLDAGWDFVGEVENGPSDDWAEPIGGGYPILWWQLSPLSPLPGFSGGTGEADDPYLVSTANELNLIGHNPRLMDKHFKLTNDIDLASVNFFLISNRTFPFTGGFDGDNYTISNFTYSSVEIEMDYIGLFEYIDDPNAEVKNLRLINPNIEVFMSLAAGSLVGAIIEGKVIDCHVEGAIVLGYYNVGGLAGGNASGAVSECSSTGSVSGNTGVGGLVGSNELFANISNSYSKAFVSGAHSVGGLVGKNIYGSISNSYSAGNILATGDYIGGLAGSNNRGDILYSYSSGSVSGPNEVGGLVGHDGSGVYTSCFWDSTINDSLSGIGNGADPNVIGESTTNMQTVSTFTDAGWDFVDIWDICEGKNYPRFLWQIPLGDFLCPDGVNFIDFAVLGSAWLSDPNDGNWNPACNISDPNDDIINVPDLAVFTENWLAGM